MTAGVLPIRTSTLRPMRDGAIVALGVLVFAHAFGLLQIGVDAHAYWASDPWDPYGATTDGQFDAYFYAPAFTQLLGPLHALPWPLFIALWSMLLGAAFVWQAGLFAGIAILFVPVFAELTVGNVHLLMSAAIVAGFRWPWLWAFPLLTKITPGIGLLWFAVRREWRNLGIAIGATAAISAVSFAVAPHLWLEWLDTLLATAAQPAHVFTIPIPLWARLAVAVSLLVWGARADHRWVVPVAAMLVMPILRVNGLSMLVAVLPLIPTVVGSTPAARWLAGGGATAPEATAVAETAAAPEAPAGAAPGGVREPA